MNSVRFKFAQLVRKEREGKGRSTEDVENEGGVSRGYQWMIENKKRNMPSIETIMKLERGIGLKCGYLVNKAVELLKDKVWY